MDGKSLTPEQEKINTLRQVLPEAFSEGKIDWEKLQATLGSTINFANERYVLNWAGKSDAFKVLQKSYFGKVKMIYIDPPYNTGNDSFIYPDKFSETKREYQERVGDKDEDGYMTKSTQKFPSFGGVSEGRGGRNSKNYFNLPYNPNLRQRARELRQAGNLSEVLFWNQVKNKQFKGYDFDRQKIVGNYIVDFYCSNCNVVIEIDGNSHNDKVEYDAERDNYLESLGLTVIHIPIAEIMNNMSGVMEMLFNHPTLEQAKEKGKDHPALKGTPPLEGNLKPDYYIVNDNELILLLEKATQEIIDAVIAEKPIKVIALDRLFKGNDQLKTNTVLQMKDVGVEFKTI